MSAFFDQTVNVSLRFQRHAAGVVGAIPYRVLLFGIALGAIGACGSPQGENPAPPIPASTQPLASRGGPPESEGELILVAGATGRTGRRIVTQLLDRGYRVRAFVRDETSARERFGDRIEYAVGDVRKPGTVWPAFVGIGKAISAIGASGRPDDPTNTPEAVDYEGVKRMVEAAASSGVEHFVLVSSVGVTLEEHPLNRMFDDILKWKLRGENALRDSGVTYTILRAGGLTEDPGGQREISIYAEDLSEGIIPRADVATVCIEVLEHHELTANKTFSILSGEGPPDFDWAEKFAAIPADE